MLKYHTITTIPAWEAIKTEWNGLLELAPIHVPFLRHEFLREWWDTCGGGEWEKGDLTIITAMDGEKLVGIAPFFLTKKKDGTRCLMFLGSFEIADYLDFIVIPEFEDVFLLGLYGYLTSSQGPAWDCLDLYNILSHSPTIPALERTAIKVGWSLTQETLQKAPYIPLVGNWEKYLAGIDKKQRHEIRRKMRRAEECTESVELYVNSERSKLAEDTEKFLFLMAQDPEKKHFLTERMREQMANTIRCAFDTGCLHLAFLEIGGVKTAAYMSFNYLNRLWVYNSGLDRSYSEYSPGWVLLGYLLRWANENGYQEFDFLRGDEEYKYRFGAIDRFVCRVTISRKQTVV
jgi:CelD/BcsL family acetyltransferase involved in cellulose biosynthesis